MTCQLCWPADFNTLSLCQSQEYAERVLIDLDCLTPQHMPAIVAAGAVPRLKKLLENLDRRPQVLQPL